jgi:hypothetical protein
LGPISGSRGPGITELDFVQFLIFPYVNSDMGIRRDGFQWPLVYEEPTEREQGKVTHVNITKLAWYNDLRRHYVQVGVERRLWD